MMKETLKATNESIQNLPKREKEFKDKPVLVMETSVCLAYGSPPCINPAPFGYSARATKLHFSINSSSSLSLSICSTNRRFGRFFSPKLRAIDRSSMPASSSEDGEKKSTKGMVGASLALACCLGIFGCYCKMNYKAMAAGPRLIYQKAPSSSSTDSIPASFEKRALNSLMEVTVNLASNKLERSRGINLDLLPLYPSKQDVETIKMEAVKMMKYGKAEEAVELLQRAYVKYKTNPEPAYNVDMAIVEILICQGKYREALERKCLHEDGPFSDLRTSLYKAIIFTMLDRNNEAKSWWKKFEESIGETAFPPSPSD